MKKNTFLLFFCLVTLMGCSNSDDEFADCECQRVTLKSNNLSYDIGLCDNPTQEDFNNWADNAVAEQAELNQQRARQNGICP